MLIKEIEITNPFTHEKQKVHVAAWYGDSRSGFNHFAECPEFNIRTKIHYINRTWEEHTYDTVISVLLEKIEDLDPEVKRAKEREARARRKARKAQRA